MNILLMSRIIARTGVGNHIKELSEELNRQGHKVLVVSSTNDLSVGENGGGIEFRNVELRSNNPLVIWKSLKQIHTLIEEYHIEIVHCHHRKASLVMSWYNKIWKIPYVYTLHLAPIPSDFVHRYFTRYGNQAIAISKEVGGFLRDDLKVPKSKISYVLNGVDESKLAPITYDEKITLREKFGIKKDKIVIAMHSRIDSVKNQMAVVEAVNMLSDAEKDRLTVLCSGEKKGEYYEAVIKRVFELQLNGNFVFCGWKMARDVIGASDVLLLPSIKEGFPLNCIEAMFMNVPVVRTQTSGFEDVKEYCIGMDDANPNTIAEHIKSIISNTEFNNDMVINANDFVNKTCTISAMAGNTVIVYKNALLK